jgi:hypothetical protein
MKLADFELKNTELSIETKLKLKQHEQEMELLMNLFDIESLDKEDVMQEIVELEKETVTQEMIEDELSLIEDYRGFALDVKANESEWINENISLNCLVGSEFNTVGAIMKALSMSGYNVKKLMRKCLGYQLGSDYQNEKIDYVEGIRKDFEDGIYEDLDKYLKKTKIYVFYDALLEYIKKHVSLKPQGVDEDELVFHVLYPDLRRECQRLGMNRGISNDQLADKLHVLCLLGLLRNLQDEQIDDKTLFVANSIAKSTSSKISKNVKVEVEINRRNHYVLNDLSPEVQDEAIARLKIIVERGLRRKDMCSTTLALLFGEELQKSVYAQGEPDINETKLRNFNKAAQQLLEKHRYYNEEMLRKQFVKVDKHTKAKDSGELTRKYLSRVAKDNKCTKTRVNPKIRERYELPEKIKSNSFIFVSENN